MLPANRLHKLPTDQQDAGAQKLFSKIHDHIENVRGRNRVFNLDNPPCHAAVPLPCQKPLSDVSGDTLTAAAILTEAAQFWREVTGITGDPAVENRDTIDDLLGDPELLEK